MLISDQASRMPDIPSDVSKNRVINTSGLLATFNEYGVLSPLDVHAAETTARMCGETDQQVILAAALAVRGAQAGNVCIRLSTQQDTVTVETQTPEMLDRLPWPEPNMWNQKVADSRMAKGPNCPLVIEDGRLYMERYHRYETVVAEQIETRAQTVPTVLETAVEAALHRLLPPGNTPDGDKQHQAAKSALTGRFTVISGGPGTGKTYVIARILAALAHTEGQFPRVALCAPTGKAAARMGEEVAGFANLVQDPTVKDRLCNIPQARTIHRLLGWARGRGRFAHNRRNLLPYDMVIVDEMSMVPLLLAAKLLEAVRPDASLVMVGDPHQLESVEAGTVLADITEPVSQPGSQTQSTQTAPPPVASRVITLKRLHRFREGSPVANFADAVRQGNSGKAIEFLLAGNTSLQWVKTRESEQFTGLWNRLIDHRVQMVSVSEQDTTTRDRDHLYHLEGMAVLCAHREGPGSVSDWTRKIDKSLYEQCTARRKGGMWYPGRPVMVTKNDYGLGLFNGDIGITVDTLDGLQVMFDRGRVIPPGYLGEHTTAHAMTIHKSQGSQFEDVVVSLPDVSSRLLTRELLYTAVTRSSGSVTLVGSEDVIRCAVERSAQRASGLGYKLWSRDTDSHK